MARRKTVRKYGVGRVYRPTYRDRDGRPRETSTWWVAYYVNGRERRESAHSTDKSTAEQMLRDRQTDDFHGRPNVAEMEKTTFQDLEKMIVDDYFLNNQEDRVLAQCRIPPLKRAFGNLRAHEITEPAILRYAIKRKRERVTVGGAHGHKGTRTYSNGTINRELAVLKRMLNLAFEQRKLARVPAINMLAENNARKGFFDWADIEKVKAHLKDPSLCALLDVAFITGWRMESELLQRRWVDVDFRGDELRLYVGEGKDRTVGRVFPLLPQLKKKLQAQKSLVENIEKELDKKISWVFVRGLKRDRGNRIASCRKMMKAAFRKAGYDRVPHDLRRSAVRSLERAGVPRSVAMQMVGHKTESMYRRYAIVDQGMYDMGKRQLSEFLEREQDGYNAEPVEQSDPDTGLMSTPSP